MPTPKTTDGGKPASRPPKGVAIPTRASIKSAVAENQAMIPAALAAINGCIWCGPHGQFEIVRGAGPMWGHAVFCSNCGGEGPGMADPMKAATIWNDAVKEGRADAD